MLRLRIRLMKGYYYVFIRSGREVRRNKRLRMEFLFVVMLQIIAMSGPAFGSSHSRRKPHIIFILADDLGWNDVGFHGSNQIPTPNLDSLAYTGVILNNYYVTPICTPTRSAIMTGKYPIHTGLQHGVIAAPAPYGLSLSEKILPEYLQENGYVTRAVGKWHLGFFKKDYTPEQRGFVSHYGYWSGAEDYYDHSAQYKEYWGYDMNQGMNSTWSDYGRYSTDLFTAEAVKIIKEHKFTEHPLFLYVAHQAVHSGNTYKPLQAPPEEIAKFAYIIDENRRTFAGMVSKLDDSVGQIVSALTQNGMINNAIIIFSTDNGGPAAGFDGNAASNWPLKGVKDTLWEGGVKGVAFIWSPLLPSGKISNSLMHAVDWLPTLLHGVNGKKPLKNIDGINLWENLAGRAPSPRNEILLNIDPIRNISGLIHDEWKLIRGHTWNGKWDKWFGPAGRDREYDWEQLWNCKTTESLKDNRPLPPLHIIQLMRNKTNVNCEKLGKSENVSGYDTDVYLYNLSNDPCEVHNIFSAEPQQVKKMNGILSKYYSSMVKPRNQPIDPRSNPKFWGYKWVNWMDYV